MGILIGVFSVAIFTDWRFYRIPNVCVGAGALAGLIMTFVSDSVLGLAAAAASMVIIFLAFYPFYLLGGVGAGDIKLFMMVGCYMRGGALVHYLLVTMLMAAVCSILKMLAYKESRERLFYLMRYIKKAVLTGAMDEYQIDRTQKKCVIRLSIPAFVSLILMCAGAY
ncbi:MAG: A24 family peptidase [Lachnospiraceae bacterium]|nr:A24 family peptidase [Lachnospiraceae bacterium]